MIDHSILINSIVQLIGQRLGNSDSLVRESGLESDICCCVEPLSSQASYVLVKIYSNFHYFTI